MTRRSRRELRDWLQKHDTTSNLTLVGRNFTALSVQLGYIVPLNNSNPNSNCLKTSVRKLKKKQYIMGNTIIIIIQKIVKSRNAVRWLPKIIQHNIPKQLKPSWFCHLLAHSENEVWQIHRMRRDQKTDLLVQLVLLQVVSRQATPLRAEAFVGTTLNPD